MMRGTIIRLGVTAFLFLLGPRVFCVADDVYETLCEYGTFETFCELTQLAGLAETLETTPQVTVFAPSDRAFGRLGEARIEMLRDPTNIDVLRNLIVYHISPERLRAADLKREHPRETLSGKTVELVLMSDELIVNDAYIRTADIAASNGIIHELDRVLSPP